MGVGYGLGVEHVWGGGMITCYSVIILITGTLVWTALHVPSSLSLILAASISLPVV